MNTLPFLVLLVFAAAEHNNTRCIRAVKQRFSIIDPQRVRPAENLLELEELRFYNLEKYIGKFADYTEDNINKGIEFAAKYSLIPNVRNTLETGKPMSLIRDTKLLDGYMWRNKAEKKKLSIREGTLFSEKKLTVQDVIYLAANFIENYEKNIEDVAKDFRTTTDTVIDYYNIFRDLCQSWCLREMTNPTGQLGGPGQIVEIDETLLYKAKYNRGRMLGRRNKQIWIFGLVERGTNKVVMFQVEKRNKETLLPIIASVVADGTIIMSDSWKAYDKIVDMQKSYQHYKVNHNVEFVLASDRRVHTQGIESTWSSLKRSLKAYYGLPKHKLDGYLFNYMFRRRLNRERMLNHLLHEISRFPPEIDPFELYESDSDEDTTTANTTPISLTTSHPLSTAMVTMTQTSSPTTTVFTTPTDAPLLPPTPAPRRNAAFNPSTVDKVIETATVSEASQQLPSSSLFSQHSASSSLNPQHLSSSSLGTSSVLTSPHHTATTPAVSSPPAISDTSQKPGSPPSPPSSNPTKNLETSPVSATPDNSKTTTTTLSPSPSIATRKPKTPPNSSKTTTTTVSPPTSKTTKKPKTPPNSSKTTTTTVSPPTSKTTKKPKTPPNSSKTTTTTVSPPTSKTTKKPKTPPNSSKTTTTTVSPPPSKTTKKPKTPSVSVNPKNSKTTTVSPPPSKTTKKPKTSAPLSKNTKKPSTTASPPKSLKRKQPSESFPNKKAKTTG